MNNPFNKALAVGLTFMFILTGCHNHSKPEIEINELKKDTIVYLLKDNLQSPTCRFSLKYKYLVSSTPNDSITELINNKIQDFISDTQLGKSSTHSFPSLLANHYLKNYNKDVKELYEADLYNNIAPEEMPSWYNYSYEISTDMERGYHGCWNYEVEEFQFTGGAHPNTFSRKMNIDSKTGKVLRKEDVFAKGAEKGICDIILQHLIEAVNEKMDEDNVHDIDGLRELGLLLDVDLFIPDNFLLKDDEIEFYYNRYEIGPYSVGDFEVNVPYAELNKYFTLK